MATGQHAIQDLALATGVSRTVLDKVARIIRAEAGHHLWPLGVKGGGFAQPHVNATHLASLLIGFTASSPYTEAAEMVLRVRGLALIWTEVTRPSIQTSNLLPSLGEVIQGLEVEFDIGHLRRESQLASEDGLAIAGPFRMRRNLGECLDDLVTEHACFKQSEFYPRSHHAKTKGERTEFKDSRIRVSLDVTGEAVTATVRVIVRELDRWKLVTAFYALPEHAENIAPGAFPRDANLMAPILHVVELYEPHIAALSAILTSTATRDQRRSSSKATSTTSEGAARPRATPPNRLAG